MSELKHQILASFTMGETVRAHFTFVPADEQRPYEVETVRGLTSTKQRHSTREEAAELFRAFVRGCLKSV